MAPDVIGLGPHDCALSSLYWTAPWVPEGKLSEAFLYCAEDWPHGPVTNKELNIALSFLGVEHQYSDDVTTLGALVRRRLRRCIALLDGHFVGLVNGKLVGRDARFAQRPDTVVYRHWIL